MRHMNLADDEFFLISHYRTLTPGQKHVVGTLVDEMAGRPVEVAEELPDNVILLTARQG